MNDNYLEVFKDLKIKFKKINEMGFVKAVNCDKSSIGMTFEKLLEIPNNNFEVPDYRGVEIKTQRFNTDSYISLFSAVPDGPNLFMTSEIKERYGYPDKILTNKKIFQGDVYGNCSSFIGRLYKFKLKIDYSNKKIYLLVFNRFNKLIDGSIYWDFACIKEKLYRKLKNLAFISASCIKKDNCFYYRYDSIEFYNLFDFTVFLKLILNGTIRVTFRIGVFRNGNRVGEIHDHGTSFSIKERDLIKLYDKVYI